jgi:type IV pilus assembly protein PilY1
VAVVSKLNSKLLTLLIPYVFLACYSAQTHALTLSQEPLFLTAGVDPNVMFVLDDSGSMRFQVMPESIRGEDVSLAGSDRDVSDLYPRTQIGIFATNENYYYNTIAPGSSDHVYGMLVRSSNNTIYYNPAIEYTPWVDKDGNEMDDADETCAYDRPFKTSCRNLVPTTNEVFFNGSTAKNSTWRARTSFAIGASSISVTVGSGSDPTGTFVAGDTFILRSNYYRILSASSSVVSGVKRWTLEISPNLVTSVGTSNYIVFAPQVVKCDAIDNCYNSRNVASMYPATYFYYSPTATDMWDPDNYTEVKIKDGEGDFVADGRITGHGRTAETREDCALVSGAFAGCTYEEEIQNFANWYTYYRNRYLTAAAGVGLAFSGFDGGMRVGYGSINKQEESVDGISTKVIKTGVRDYSGDDKEGFFENLYEQNVSGGTPLRLALATVGEYYKDTTDAGPWSNNPGGSTESTTNHVACRASYTILMSDGYWNDRTDNDTTSSNHFPEALRPDNADGDDDDTTANYDPADPFQDEQSDTLADVAMKYWMTDLYPPATNDKVPEGVLRKEGEADFVVDHATWQHMTTYTVGLGVEGTLNVNYDVNDVLKNGLKDKDTGNDLDWPDVGSESGDNEEKIDDMFHAAVNGRGAFFSARKPDEFAAGLTSTLNNLVSRDENSAAAAAANSTSLQTDSAVYTAVFNSKTWVGSLKAREVSAAGVVDDDPTWESSIPDAGARTIFSFNDETKNGIVFAWSNLSDAQKADLKDGDGTDGDSDAAGQERLNWLKGENPDDADAAAYDLRDRDNPMGDIVNSDPGYAANTDMGYSRLSAALGGDKYKEFYNDHKKGRREVIYVGANDGMMHAFNAKNPTSGSEKTLGVEIFAYVPSQGYENFSKLAARDYGDSVNEHRYFVDGPITIGDAYVNGDWKNILVGTLGAGGKGIYVLDVTDPDAMNASKVLFELTDDDYPQLGNITGRAIVAPGADKRWKIFLGNGYNSDDGKAYLGIIDIGYEINPSSGGHAAIFIEAGSATDNALAQPALLGGPQGYVTAAYAGDLKGNLWKFDLSDADNDLWKLAFSNSPLFVAKTDEGAIQPITASPTLGFNSALSPARVMVYFGTGRYVASTDNAPVTTVQSFYAIADKDAVVSDRDSLHEKTLSESGSRRTIGGEVSDGVGIVPWATVSGWYLDFPANERIITKPLLIFDRLIFPTVIPSDDVCEAGGRGWLMELIGVGDKNVTYTVLGDIANQELTDPIYGQLSTVEGPGEKKTPGSAAGSGSSASASNECGAGANSGKSGTVAILGNDAKGSAKSFVGGRPCDLYGRQSWRELE